MARKLQRAPAGQRPASALHYLLLTGALALPPLVMRAVQIADRQAGFGGTDVRGLVSDLAAIALWTLGLAALLRASRWACVGLAMFWALMCYANYESIRALGSMLTLDYAGYMGDTTFLRGSVLAPAHPLLFGVLFLGAGASVWASGRGAMRHFALLPLGGAAAMLVGVALLWPFDAATAGWRQTNFLGANLRYALSGGSASGGGSTARLPTDLDGEPLIALGHPGQNVLLIILEGISSAHLPALASAHGYRGLPTRMPELERVVTSQLHYTTFIAQQRQTNRGEYALLCGDLPKLLTDEPKMSELAGAGPLDCLPAALREEGYETVYLQAAPLPFMFKDQFMAQAGYTTVIGDEYFPTYYGRSHWGVDDRAYLEQAVAEIERLHSGDSPWFLTLLTVGTHHPYNAPRHFTGRSRTGSYGWAVEYLDDALGTFLARLETLGVFEDTLVVLTSDESNGIQTDPDDTTRMLTQGWGLLSMRVPSGERARVEEPFMQSDLPISILDYLGYEEQARRFGGRSAFRQYSASRPLYWANTYLKLVAGVDRGGTLHVCPESFEGCSAFAVRNGQLFAMQRQPTSGDPDFLREAARRSLASNAVQGSEREFDLVVAPEFALHPDQSLHFIFGGQFLEAARGTRIDVDLDFVLEGSGQVAFRHDLVSRGAKRAFQPAEARLEGGQRATLRYSFLTDRDLDRIEARMMVSEVSGQNLALRFDEARLRLVPNASGEPGFEPHEMRIAPAR